MAAGRDSSDASKTRRRAAVALCLLASGAACRGSGLTGVTGKLELSTPDDPAALLVLDAGLVRIDFGQVIVGGSKALALDLTSVGSIVTLGATVALQPDAEFTLPFQSGTAVGSVPVAVTLGFSPTSAGTRTATFQLTDYSPGAAVVVIEVTGVGLPSGLTVVPNPVDFGEVEVNRTQAVPVTITNSGSLPANLTFGPVLGPLQGGDAGPFALGAPSAITLAPNASATLSAVFAPLLPGDSGASFTVGGWTETPPVTVNLTGIGSRSWLQVVSPVDFGFVPLGKTVVKPAQITNIGSYLTLYLIAPAPNIKQPVGSNAFSLALAPPTVPLALAPGQSASVQVAFAPASVGAFTGTLFFTTDDPGEPYPAVQLEGYGGGPEIQCQPLLSFGPTPYGYLSTEPALCTNIGPDIPSHPEIKLEIAGSGLSTDDAAFSATLRLPDGGLAGPNDSVGLSSGQSATLQVRFAPQDAGVYEGHLAVASNDTHDLDAGITLTGEGIVPGLCNLEAIPRELSFGDVPPRSVGTLQLELDNTGQNLCVVSHIALDPSSAAGFSLPGGDPGPLLLSYPGDPDNPAGRPSVFRIPVQYAASTVLPAAAGTIDITAPNASPPDLTVSLTASSAYGCFTVEPASFDFGPVVFSPVTQQICTMATRSFTGTNGCGAPVSVTQLKLGPLADGGAQLAFSLDLEDAFPDLIEPGSNMMFQVSFTPAGVGSETGSILVTSSDSPNALTVAASFEGDAELGPPRTDTFIVPTPPKELDLVWVLDDDDDLTQVQNVAALLPQLIDALNKAQIDWQMAATSTDTCDAGTSDIGFFEPCDHCLSQASSDPLYVTSTTADAGDAMVNLLGVFDKDPKGHLCDSLNGDEHLFDSIADAFSSDNLAGHNAGFLRPEADLAIVVVNGDFEDDANGRSGAAGQYLTNLQQVTTLVESLKPDAGMASVSYINSGAGALQAGQDIGKLVQATDGSEIDSTQPAAVWQNALLDLFAFGNGAAPFRLSVPATLNGGIQVDVDGTPVTGWSFDPYQNAIVFDPASLPAPGATVTVTYRLGCQ